MSRETQIARAADIVEALALLSRLPLPPHRGRGAASAWAWPIAGVIVALIAGALALLATGLGVPAGLAAGLALAVQVALTGGLHEDGLADTADGFWGGTGRARRLEIMKDSRIGSYGVIALVLSYGLRWNALGLLFAGGALLAPLLAAAVLSRGAMVVLMSAMPNARGSGLSAAVGRPAGATAFLAVAVALLVSFVFVGSATVASASWLALGTMTLGAVAWRKIGGQTGDVLGACQQIGEITVLAVLASLT